MKTPKAETENIWRKCETTSHGVREDMPFEHVALSRELKHEKEPSMERVGYKAFWAEGIACAVALRQRVTWSVSGTKKEQQLWPEEQRGEPLGRAEAGEVSKDGSHVTLGESLDFIPSTVLSVVLFSSCCNCSHYLAQRTCQLSPDFAGIPMSICSADQGISTRVGRKHIPL